MADWVKAFYQAQNRWMGVYLRDIDAEHWQRVQKFRKLFPRYKSEELDILELGAGGGQTACLFAKDGHRVHTIELLEESCVHARQLAREYKLEKKLNIVQGDFYQYEFPEKAFDYILYFDSFGIGSDKEQQRLLGRAKHWLKDEGRLFIEVGSTWYWASEARGHEMDLGAYTRRYDFDFAGNRLLDYWWPKGKEDEILHQSLRCYTPSDLELLISPLGLALESYWPGGRVDYLREQFIPEAELAEAMTFYTSIKKGLPE